MKKSLEQKKIKSAKTSNQIMIYDHDLMNLAQSKRNRVLVICDANMDSPLHFTAPIEVTCKLRVTKSLFSCLQTLWLLQHCHFLKV